METKTAYWMRYIDEDHFAHVAVVADSLDDAFDKLLALGIDNKDISYRNREIEVII